MSASLADRCVLRNLIELRARETPDRTFIVFPGLSQWTHAELRQRVRRAARGLQDLGVTKGTRVALFLPNTPYYVVCYFAVMKLGGIVVNVNPLYAEEEVHELLSDSGAEFAVTLDLKLLLPKLASALGNCALKKIIVGTMGEILRFPKRQLFAIAKRGELSKVPGDDERYLRFSKLIDNDGGFTPAEVDVDDDASSATSQEMAADQPSEGGRDE